MRLWIGEEVYALLSLWAWKKVAFGGFCSLREMIGRKAWDIWVARRGESSLLEADHEDLRKEKMILKTTIYGQDRLHCVGDYGIFNICSCDLIGI